MRTGTDAFVCRDADGQEALRAHGPVFFNDDPFRGTEAEEEADIAEIVDVVIHLVQTDGRDVGHVHAPVEGKFVQKGAGAEAVAVEQADQRHEEGGKAGDREAEVQELLQKAFLRVCAAQGIDVRLDPVADVVDGIGKVEASLADQLALVDVIGILQHVEGNGAVVPCKELLVHDEAVDAGILAERAYIGGDQDGHIAQLFALIRLLVDIGRQEFHVRAVL